MVGIDQFLIDHPLLIKYFKNGTKLPDAPSDEKEKVMMAAEMMIDYFDNVFHQQQTLPSDEAYQGFVKYMQDTYSNSPALKLYLQKNEWYPQAFLQMITQNVNRPDQHA